MCYIALVFDFVGVTVWFGLGSVVSLCRLKLCFSLHTDTTPPQPNHTVTPKHIEPEQYNPWNKSTLSRKFLKMDVLTFETCWAVNSEIIKQVTSIWSIFIRPFVSEIFNPAAAGWHKVECRSLTCYTQNELLNATSYSVCCTFHFFIFCIENGAWNQMFKLRINFRTFS
jgi:hypothetical protein